MAETRVVHVRKDSFDEYIGRAVGRAGFRGSIWGNPYQEGRDGTLEEVLAKYEAHVLGSPELLAQLPELDGKTLGCWCAPKGGLTASDPLICHGQKLIRLIEAQKGA